MFVPTDEDKERKDQAKHRKTGGLLTQTLRGRPSANHTVRYRHGGMTSSAHPTGPRPVDAPIPAAYGMVTGTKDSTDHLE